MFIGAMSMRTDSIRSGIRSGSIHDAYEGALGGSAVKFLLVCCRRRHQLAR